MANKRYDVVTVGDCKADQFLKLDRFKIFSGPGGRKFLGLAYAQKLSVSEFGAFSGGNALNAAVNFSRLGLRAAVATVLGDDHEAEHILEVMRREKIGMGLVVRQRGTVTDKTVIIVTGGERTILGYHDEKNYRRLPQLRSTWVYLTSLGQEYKPVYDRIYANRRAGDFRLAFNPGSRQLVSARSAVIKLLGATDLLFLNLEEAQKLSGLATVAPRPLLKKLYDFGAGVPVITDGGRGAYVFSSGKFLRISAFPAKRVDSTGAGDAFASGFTAAVAFGQTVEEALRWGSVSAAGEIGHIGVHTGLPEKFRILALLKSKPGYRPRKI
ncbi:MAG: carbohydrate kinase family protein [Patescibacteria group bacterium]|nr:carbohydrate kinase family protein [Patescibacteria group bacterium]